jgi:hypothetical protein
MSYDQGQKLKDICLVWVRIEAGLEPPIPKTDALTNYTTFWWELKLDTLLRIELASLSWKDKVLTTIEECIYKSIRIRFDWRLLFVASNFGRMFDLFKAREEQK